MAVIQHEVLVIGAGVVVGNCEKPSWSKTLILRNRILMARGKFS